MPEKRIGPAPGDALDVGDDICLHREHAPAKHVVRRPGTYEHTCPGCGATTVFIIPPKPRYREGRTWSGGHAPDTYL